MTVLILLLCTVAALFIHRAFIRPILAWFEEREYKARMREAEERALLEHERRSKCR